MMTMRLWCRAAAVLLLTVWNAPWTTSVASELEFPQSCVASEETQYFCGLRSRHLSLDRELWEPQPPCHDGSSSTGLSPVRNNSKILNIKKVWRGLTRIANLENLSSDKPVVLGFGICKDVIVDAVSLLNTLVKEGLIDDKDVKAVHHDEVGIITVAFLSVVVMALRYDYSFTTTTYRSHTFSLVIISSFMFNSSDMTRIKPVYFIRM